MSEVNSVYFTEEQFKNGTMEKFIHTLSEMSYDEGKYKFEILIEPADCGAFNVEFIQIPWDESFGGHFEFVDEDELVMMERQFPDGTFQYFRNDDEWEEEFNLWLKNNPGYEKSEFGVWHKKD